MGARHAAAAPGTDRDGQIREVFALGLKLHLHAVVFVLEPRILGQVHFA